MTTKREKTKTPAFDDEAATIITQVRNAFAAIIESLPGHVARAHEVSGALGIHKKLGWQISKVVYEADPFIAAQHIPGRTSVKKFLNAASEQNIEPAVIASAEAAMADFERLIKVHADDRESFQMMATGYAGKAAYDAQLGYRKALFDGGGFIWGVQARVHLAASFVYPAPDEPWLNLVSLRGFTELRRIRSDVAWPIQTAKAITDDGTELSPPAHELLEPVDEASQIAGVPLLRRFCTQPIPEVRRVCLSDGTIRDELVGGTVGKTGAVDCILGEIVRKVGMRYRDPHFWEWGVACHIRTPCAVLILDQFVHRDLFGPIEPRLEVYNDLLVDPRQPSAQRAGDRIPVFETVQHLGKGLSSIRTPDVPRYVEMVGYVMERMGWEADQFDVYRVRIEFPPLPTTVAMLNDLPEAPETGGTT